MKEIPLTQGKVVLVDDKDYNKLKDLKWHASKFNNHYYYAAHGVYKKSSILMHRLILNLRKGEICDHINGNGLDNRRCNLRIVTTAQNSANSDKTKRQKSSKYKGVTFFKRRQKWVAVIKVNYKLIYLGIYDNEIDAAKAYNKEALKLFGEYARLSIRC